VTGVRDDGNGVKVEVEGGQVYRAKVVVVCLPLGVLKREEKPIQFVPELSPAVRERFG
jgi:monoamine oxidase